MVVSESDTMSTLQRYFGLSEHKAAETVRNKQLAASLLHIAALVDGHLKVDCSVDKSLGALLYQLATRLKPQCSAYLPLIVKHICSNDIRNDTQLTAAMDFALKNCHVQNVDDSQEFRSSCGIGATVSPDDIESAVAEAIGAYRDELVQLRYAFNVGKLMGAVKKNTKLKWADGSAVKREIDLQILEVLGPKTAQELAGNAPKPVVIAKKEVKVEAKKAGKENGAAKTVEKPSSEGTDGASNMDELLRTRVHLHEPGMNHTTDGYVTTPKTMDLLQQHLKRTGGKVRTRFPPEPNGILHIGHAKAININFGYARARGGECYLRFDDTNPEKEEQKFFEGIIDMVQWLGYTPTKITYSSDNFDRLYDLAVQLIKRGLAYVCHQPADQLKGFDVPDSPWRERPIEENVQLFADMKNGKIAEGAATLRMKHVMEEGKKDPVAYRINVCDWHLCRLSCLSLHCQTLEPRCIYPTYEFTHCLCDSAEDITHSLCTKEFQSRRSSYYWLCNALDLYCPVQWEYSRLEVEYTVVSKRKIQKLVEKGVVKDWDDPRLFTLTALRRRGCPPQAINNFVAQMGLTVAQTSVEPTMLDACVRDVLNQTARRCMCVVHPLLVRIINWNGTDKIQSISVPDFPGRDDSPTHEVSFCPEFFIESEDFREEGDKNYKRLTIKQTVGLKHIGKVLTVEKVVKDAQGNPSELHVSMDDVTASNKPKAFVHWVAKGAKVVELRLYERLFKHANPEDPNVAPGGFLDDCNENSLSVVHDALIDQCGAAARAYDNFQFERIGYFSVDPDSTNRTLIFNRTVLLREDSGKS